MVADEAVELYQVLLGTKRRGSCERLTTCSGKDAQAPRSSWSRKQISGHCRQLLSKGCLCRRVKRIHALQATDYPLRVDFCRWFLQQCAAQADFPSDVLSTEQATFTQEDAFNMYNSHVWATDNPHAIRPHAFQIHFSVNVWAGIVNDYLIGPYLPTCPSQWLMLSYFSASGFTGIASGCLSFVIACGLRHDGTPAHYDLMVWNYLDANFAARWIKRGGPVRWAPRLPDLSSVDFFL
ncbi:hypothetical protein X975_20149, partial [Stegodyphus mimosarum]